MLSGKLVDRRQVPRTLTNGRLPGRLSLVDGDEILCKSLDVSPLGLGLESPQTLSEGVKLVLELATGAVVLEIVTRLESGGKFRYGLLATKEINLESIFRATGCLAPAEPEPKRPPRFSIDDVIHVEVKTFGTRSPYHLRIENLSRSGLLIATTSAEVLPFRVNTLVDLRIDPEGRAFRTPIEAAGKVVRRTGDGAPGKPENTTRLGIALVDMGTAQSAAWNAALDQLESPQGIATPRAAS